jgi:hypothetical protein
MSNNLQPNKSDATTDYSKEEEYCLRFLKGFEDPDMQTDSQYGRKRYMKELVSLL